MWMTYKMLEEEWLVFLSSVQKGQWSKSPPRVPRELSC